MLRTAQFGIAALLILAVSLAIGVGPFPRTTLAAEQPTTAPSVDRVAALVKQLGDSDWQTRERAQKELIALGAAARQAVEAAAKSSDPEVAQRAEAVLDQIIMVDNPDYEGWKRVKVGSTVKVETVVQVGVVRMQNGMLAMVDAKTVFTRTLKEISPERAILSVQTEGAAAAETVTVPVQVKRAATKPAGKVTRQEQSEEELEFAGKKLKCRRCDTTETLPDGKTVSTRTWSCEQVPGGVASIERQTTVPASSMLSKAGSLKVLEFRSAD